MSTSAPERCRSCVFLDRQSGRAYCPFAECIQDGFVAETEEDGWRDEA